MSLLLDARKKIELALEQSGVHSAIEPQLSETMRLEDLPHGSPAKGASPDTHHAAGDSGATSPQRSDPVAAGKNLFAAKSAPAKKRIGIIPIAIISGLVLAAGGGYYVWREISPHPMAQRKIPAPQPAAPIAQAAPPATPAPQPVASTSDKPAVVATTSNEPSPAATAKSKTTGTKNTAQKQGGKGRGDTAHSATDMAPPPPDTSPQDATAEQAIRLRHGQGSDAVDPALLAGYQAYRNGDLRTAWQHYSDVLHKDARNRDALLGLAAIAQQQSQDDIAARYYEQVLALDPRDPVAYAGMSTLFGATNATATESRLKLMISQQPKSAALHFALGNRYAEQSRWGEAQQAFFNAYNIDSGNAQFAFNLAVSLDHLGQGKPAAQYYQRALQLDTMGNAGFDRGQTQQRLYELTTP